MLLLRLFQTEHPRTKALSLEQQCHGAECGRVAVRRWQCVPMLADTIHTAHVSRTQIAQAQTSIVPDLDEH
jgi:hypothetical protein